VFSSGPLQKPPKNISVGSPLLPSNPIPLTHSTNH
jgi:hypothetical protein